jgi:hypothetical protein
MKLARIATPVLILVVTITAAAVVVFGQWRPSPFSANGSVAIDSAYAVERYRTQLSLWMCRCKAVNGGELFLEGEKVADVAPLTEFRPLAGHLDRGRDLRPVRGVFELRSGRTVATLQGDVHRR